MPSNLTFNQTKKFRDYILSRNIKTPNGPETFSEENYEIKELNIYSNKSSGGVTNNRENILRNFQKNNKFKPNEYSVIENINTIPQTENLKLYPYFTPESHTLIGILTSDKFENESNLFKFSASYIKSDPNGPLSARIAQNLNANINGKNRLLDVSNNNISTLTNILTGKEPLIEKNNRITVSSTLLGKGVDFIKTISGVELPFSEIPGNYLSNPRQENSPNILQNIGSTITSYLGINKKNNLPNNPSDIMVEHLGDGQKSNLFNLLSYSKYAPNYTTKARSKTSSQLLNNITNFGQSVKNLLGLEAPDTISYIGDDRANNVKYSMSDFNDNIVRSNYYLSLLFDPVQTQLLKHDRNITERGKIGGNLTWVSKNSKNILGSGNKEYTSSEQSALLESLSTKYGFRSDSILAKTQELLDSLPSDGGSARTHVANAIDQTTRIFKEGDKFLSRGSAIKYVDRFNEEKGVEYCRVWTKDRPYYNFSDTMKRTGTIRKIDSSVLSKPWNLNIAPMSNGKIDIGDSTNLIKRNESNQNSFYAKKYMFSIENLAWSSSNSPGYTYDDLPYCERGPNNGRVMWFPPYSLKFSESSDASWDETPFLGRPEPIYVYQNTKRNGTISFKLIVDHPSIINLLVREHFKNMTNDDEVENYINAFFAGCEELDFYDLITKYSTLDVNEINSILQYLNKSNKTDNLNNVINNQNEQINVQINPAFTPSNESVVTKSIKANLKFDNGLPNKSNDDLISTSTYEELFNQYINKKDNYIQRLNMALNNLVNTNFTNEKLYIFNSVNDAKVENISKQVNDLTTRFDTFDNNFGDYVDSVSDLKQSLDDNKVDKIIVNIKSTTSSIDTAKNNKALSVRRAYSIMIDFIKRISNNNSDNLSIDLWPKYKDVKSNIENDNFTFNFKFPIRSLGFENNNGEIYFNISAIGESDINCKNKDFINISDLNYTAPICFDCRQGDIDITYYEKQINPVNPTVSPISTINTTVTNTPTTVNETNVYRPTLENMKKLVLKVLNESYYFKQLEESSPLVFNSLKEKLTYFHPGFHSMTPEGLNSRLTFLHQCLRPGQTIPIKDNAVNSTMPRNTTFGTPPICILRIGDFYHSKIIIRSVQYDYDEGLLDLNPEGIGVQPMIANVTLSVSFLGGQGMEKPIEILQNALSSNFYANTEIYDDKSINTITTIDGKSTELFLNQFFSGVTEQNKLNITTNSSEIIEGVSIGTIEGNEINYKNLIGDLKNYIDKYFEEYGKTYNNITEKYGKILSSLFFSLDYRTINEFDIYYNSSLYNTINLFGSYSIIKNLSVYKRQLLEYFDFYMGSKRYVDVLGLNKIFNNKDLDYLELKINKFFTNKIHDKLSNIDNESSIKTFETGIRQNIIETLDKLNFVTKYGYDVKYDNKKFKKIEFSNYDIFDDYSYYVEYLTDNYNKLFNILDNRIDFNDITFTDELMKEFIFDLLTEFKNEILEEIFKDSYFNKDINKTKITNFFIKNLKSYTLNIFKLKDLKPLNSIKNYKTTITNSNNDITDNNAIIAATNIFSNKKTNSNKLNFYKI